MKGLFENDMRDVFAGVGCAGAEMSAITMYMANQILG